MRIQERVYEPSQVLAPVEQSVVFEHPMTSHQETEGSSFLAVWRMMKMFMLTFGMSMHYLFRSIFGVLRPRFSSWYMQLWSRRILQETGIRVSVQGEKLPEGCILIANHRSYVDIPVVMSSLPCTFLAKASVRSWPVIGWAARIVNTIFVERENKISRTTARNQLKERLMEGTSVIVFAEGTTTPQGQMLSMRPGMFYVAAEHDLPVVPVCIEYVKAEDAWVGDDTFFRHFLHRFRQPEMKVVVSYGPVLRGHDGNTLKEQTEQWILGELSKEIEQRFEAGHNPLDKEFCHE